MIQPTHPEVVQHAQTHSPRGVEPHSDGVVGVRVAKTTNEGVVQNVPQLDVEQL